VLLSSAAAEELPEHIERIVLSGRLARLVPLETLFAVPVEDLPLLGIGQDLVRLRDGDEFVVRGCIARVLVGMILLRQLAICFLDRSRVGRPPDAELRESAPSLLRT